MSTKPWYIFAAFRLQISGCWMWTIIASSVAHSLLVFLEPRPGMGPEDGSLSAGTLRALEVLFIAVYATDVGLKVAYMGLKSYVKKPWQKLMIAIVVLLTLDVCGFSNVRFARALRPGKSFNCVLAINSLLLIACRLACQGDRSIASPAVSIRRFYPLSLLVPLVLFKTQSPSP